MKKFPILLIMLLAMTISDPLWAKKRSRKKRKERTATSTGRRKERKATSTGSTTWQQRKDDMNPSQFKDLIEENHKLKTGQGQLEEEMKLAKEELGKLKKLKQKIDALRRKKGLPEEEDYTDLSSLFGQQKNTSQGVSELGEFSKEDWKIDDNGRYYIKGLVFKVQIGAYRNHDLSEVLEEGNGPEAFEQEKLIGFNVYTLRHFRNYWKADKFKKEIRAMGVKDAYIVCFVDGKRVSLKSVLPQVRDQPK